MQLEKLKLYYSYTMFVGNLKSTFAVGMVHRNLQHTLVRRLYSR